MFTIQPISLKLLTILIVVAVPLSKAATLKKTVVTGEYTVTNLDKFANLTLKLNTTYLSIRGGCTTRTGLVSFLSDSIVKIGPFVSSEGNCTGSADQILMDNLILMQNYALNATDLVFASPNLTIFLKKTADLSEKINATTYISTFSNMSSILPSLQNSAENQSKATPTISTFSNPPPIRNQPTQNFTGSSSLNTTDSSLNTTDQLGIQKKSADLNGNNSNNIDKSNYLPPNTTILDPSPSKASTPTIISADRYSNSSANELLTYTITPNFAIFSSSFIASSTDANLPSLLQFLLVNYGAFIKNISTLAVFKKYEDSYLQYQILYSQSNAAYNAIILYSQNSSPPAVLQSVKKLELASLSIDYSGCDVKDEINRNCKMCSEGYKNFRGKCFLYNPYCAQYQRDQCSACIFGKILSKGQCS